MSELGSGKFPGQILVWDGIRAFWFPDAFPAPLLPPVGSKLVWFTGGSNWTTEAPAITPGPTLDLTGDPNGIWGADTIAVPVTFILPPRTDGTVAIRRTFKDVRGNAGTNAITIVTATLFNGTNGSSNGSTTYTDLTATFITTGIAPGDTLVVPGGPGAGTYRITAVPSQTTLTISVPVPADAGPVAYQIGDQSFDNGLPAITITTAFGTRSISYFSGFGWRTVTPEIPAPGVRGTVIGSIGSALTTTRRPVEEQGRSVGAAQPAYATARGASLEPTFSHQFFKLASDGNSLWAIDAGNFVVRFSKETGQQDVQISAVPTFTGLICAAGFLWVMEDIGAGQLTVVKYSLTSPGTILGTVNTGLPNDDGAQPIAFDGRFLFIPSDDGAGNLTLNSYDVYDNSSSTTAGDPGLNNIQQIACGNGRVVVSANSGIYVYNADGSTYLGQYPQIGTPSGLAFDGTYFYYIDTSLVTYQLVRLRVPLDVTSALPLETDFVTPLPINATSLFFDGTSLWAILSSPGQFLQILPSGGFSATRDIPEALDPFNAPFNLRGNFGYPHFDGEALWVPGLTTGLVRLAPVKPGGQRKMRRQATLTTTPYNVTLVDEVLGFSTAVHATTVNLPDFPFDSMELTIYDSSGTADIHAITINAGAGQNIEGSGSLVIGNNFGKRHLFYNASLTRWYVLFTG
jgi:hypothetical protein